MAKSKKVIRPEKKTDEELFKAIEDALNNKSYYFTPHSKTRANQRRNVTEIQVVKILKSKTKYHEKKKDEFKEEFNTWNYSVRGKTIDSENVRIAVSFDENDMLIVTVINLDE